MRQAERLETILEWLSGNGSVNVADISGELGVSAATVRRDLGLLERQRLLARTHGGAVAHGVFYELPLRYKGGRHKEEKLRIAREAATRVAEGHAVGLTGGTTTTEVARALAVRPDLAGNAEGPQLTVVTNALNIANELLMRSRMKIVVTGGIVRPQSFELVGPLGGGILPEVTLDMALLGADALDPVLGAAAHNEGEAAMNALMVSRARRVVLIADSSKLGGHAFARICPIERIETLVTDSGAGAQLVAAFESAGVRVVRA